MPDLELVKRPENPCISVCKFPGGICEGCYRTLYEKNTWARMTDEEKRATIMTLAIRKRHAKIEKAKVKSEPIDPLPTDDWPIAY